MKMHVNFDVCEGHGDCVIAAPQIFALDDFDDKVVLLQSEPPEEFREKGKDAVQIFPVLALALED